MNFKISFLFNIIYDNIISFSRVDISSLTEIILSTLYAFSPAKINAFSIFPLAAFIRAEVIQ